MEWPNEEAGNGGVCLREAVPGTYKQRPLRYPRPTQRPKCSKGGEREKEREKIAPAPTCGTRTVLLVCYHAEPQKLGPLQANNHGGGGWIVSRGLHALVKEEDLDTSACLEGEGVEARMSQGPSSRPQRSAATLASRT